MRRLVFLVEGDVELIFINNHIIPYFYRKGYLNPMQAQKIITNRQLQKKGGNVNFDYLRNDIDRVLAQGNVIVTTLVDFFRLPTNFPGFTDDADKITSIESAIHDVYDNHQFVLPYIQKHEMEALMYSSMDGFNMVVDEDPKLEQLEAILSDYENPEDINNHPDTAPSKRMIKIFGYKKVADGEMILDAVGIDRMIDKCPRFRNWLEKLEVLLQIP